MLRTSITSSLASEFLAGMPLVPFTSVKQQGLTHSAPFVALYHAKCGESRHLRRERRAAELRCIPCLPCTSSIRRDKIRSSRARTAIVYAASSSRSDTGQASTASKLGSIGLVLSLAVANRVLNKMATVPMGDYLFFLAQIQTFGYVAFYGAILYSRSKSGQVSQKMLEAPDNRQFVLVGALEATAQLISMICVSKLPGVVLPLLNQTILLWQVILGYTILGERYSNIQLAGIFLVIMGVVKAAWPQGTGRSVLGQTDPSYLVLFSFAFLLLSAASVLKDKIFADASKKLNGQKLDLFIVNTKGSTAQAGFVLLLLPVMSSLKGIAFRQLPSYCAEGIRAFLGKLPGSSGAPLVPLLYIAVNLAMNIAALNLLRTSGALITTLTMSSTIPLTIFAFTFSWPLIGAASSLNPNFIVGTAVLLAGLAAYNWPQLSNRKLA